LLDPHGGLYEAVVKYCAQQVLNREIVLLDVSAGKTVVGFNPFRKSDDVDVRTQVDRRVAATLHAWNTEATQTPRATDLLRSLYTTILLHDLSMPQALQLAVHDGQHRTSAFGLSGIPPVLPPLDD